jgi:cellulose synthase/poly-beta-1,6-N-acetylglucosamine synthase-like glycosyltransferase
VVTLETAGLVVLAAITAAWAVRVIAIHSKKARGPVLSRRTIPDVLPAGMVSIIVPGKDEEGNIRAALETLQAQDYASFEVIVVDDRSRDRTAAVAREVAAADPRVHVIQVRELPPGWFGKPHAMHAGAGEARGEWLLFVDADCRQAPHSVRAGVNFLTANGGDMLSLWPILEMHGFWEHAVQTVAGSVLVAWFRPGWVNDPRRRTAFANGQYILIRRATYEAVGGYEAIRNELVEDIAMARRVKKAGHRLFNAVGEDIFTTRMYDSLGAMYRGWTRIYCGGFRTPLWLVVVMVLTALFTLVPFAALATAAVMMAAGDAGGPTLLTFALSALSVLFALATMRQLFILGRANPWYLVFYPLAAVLVLWFEAGAMMRSLGLSRVTWRGTSYKGGKVVGGGGTTT